jgi:tetratricopeptide (TPR) repeat protein
MVADNDVFDKILRQGPSPGTLYLLLESMKEQGQLKRVIQEGIKALKAHPEDIQIRRLLGEAYLEAGLVGQAESELEQIISEVDRLNSLFKLLATIYVDQNRWEEASHALKRYMGHFPDDEEAVELLSKISPKLENIYHTSPAKPHAHAEVRADKSPLPKLATPTLAEIYLKQGQVEEAINIYEKIVSEKPDDIKSSRRLTELKSMGLEREQRTSDNLETIEARKRRMINTLEGWLGRIQELKHAV